MSDETKNSEPVRFLTTQEALAGLPDQDSEHAEVLRLLLESDRIEKEMKKLREQLAEQEARRETVKKRIHAIAYGDKPPIYYAPKSKENP